MVIYVNAIMAQVGIPPSGYSSWSCEMAQAAMNSKILEK
jgi:hypothetical protein